MKVCGGCNFQDTCQYVSKRDSVSFKFSFSLAIVVNDCSGSSYGLNNSSPTTMPQGRLQWRLLYYFTVI